MELRIQAFALFFPAGAQKTVSRADAARQIRDQIALFDKQIIQIPGPDRQWYPFRRVYRKTKIPVQGSKSSVCPA